MRGIDLDDPEVMAPAWRGGTHLADKSALARMGQPDVAARLAPLLR